MLKAFAIIWITLSLVGCATCQPVKIFRATSDNPTQNISVLHELDRIAFMLGQHASLSIAPCSIERVVKGSICISVRVANAKTARFTGTTFIVNDQRNGSSSQYLMSDLDYEVICEVSSKGIKSCSSTEDAPVSGAIQMEELRRFKYRDKEHYIRRYSFSASEEFTGAQAKEGPAIWRLFDETENWREYKSVVVKEPLLGSAITLYIPSLIVDGTRFDLPRVRFETVTEKICHDTELM